MVESGPPELKLFGAWGAILAILVYFLSQVVGSALAGVFIAFKAVADGVDVSNLDTSVHWLDKEVQEKRLPTRIGLLCPCFVITIGNPTESLVMERSRRSVKEMPARNLPSFSAETSLTP